MSCSGGKALGLLQTNIEELDEVVVEAAGDDARANHDEVADAVELLLGRVLVEVHRHLLRASLAVHYRHVARRVPHQNQRIRTLFYAQQAGYRVLSLNRC